MLKRSFYLLLVLISVTVTSNGHAEIGFYINAKEVIITEVNMVARTITYLENKKEITKIFSMELGEDVYYSSTIQKFNLAKMPINRKYFVRTRYISEDDYKSTNQNMKGEVYYVGTVRYPF